MQKEYDAGDESASRAISAANGANKAGVKTESEVSLSTISYSSAKKNDGGAAVDYN